MSKITKEMRQKALLEDYKNRGKSDRNWYLIDSTVLKEEYGVESFTPDEGSVFLAVLERWESEKFFLELFVHYNVGPDNHAFLCVNKMFGDTCPVCALREELKMKGEPEDIYNEYRYTRRYLMWIVNMETPRTIKNGVFIYDTPMTVKNGILDVCVNPRSGEIIDPSDSEEKVNIVFKRIGKKGYRRTEYKGFKLEDREDEIPEEYYDLPEMEKLIVTPDVSEIKQCLGIVTKPNHREIEPESEEKPARTSRFRPVEREEKEEPKTGRRRFPEPETEEDKTSPEETGIFDSKKYSEEETEVDEEKEKKDVLDRTRRRLGKRRE